MTATELAADIDARAVVAMQARVSVRAVVDVLRGYPARRRLYAAVLLAAETQGLDRATIPGRSPVEVAAWKAKRQPAPKTTTAPPKPCPDCAGLREERDFARGEVATLRGIVAELRARVAVLEAASAPSVGALRADAPTAPCGRDEKVQVVQVRQPAPRLAAVPPARPVVTLDLSALPPDALGETG